GSVGQRLAGLPAIRGCPGLVALHDMVGRTVETALVDLGSCAVALAADLIVGIANPLHLLIRVSVAVSIMRNLREDLLPQGLMSLPVSHDGIVELPGGA